MHAINLQNAYQFTLFNLIAMLLMTCAIGVIIGQMPRLRKIFILVFVAVVVFMTITLWGEGRFQ